MSHGARALCLRAGRRRRWTAVAGIALVASAAGCNSCLAPARGDAKVDGVLLAQADGVTAPPPGPTVVVKPITKLTAAALPAARTIRLVIDRNVRWDHAERALATVRAAGKTPVVLVGQRWRVRAFHLEDKLVGRAIRLVASKDGKSCVAPPGSVEAKCVQGFDKQHIDRAWTRQLVREAMHAYKLHDVLVYLPKALAWADAVRAIDGARTCCGKALMRVAIRHKERGPPQH